ncbi:GNAT family N-acetyltransferase [Rhodothermus marinus]|uniref:GNAT family N-acetyltransferase n=1 Tax=Rhodothermus marinus TaxID=29549 RepID=UPI0012BA482E|nr:GNAT family N-acetyltransferase [Rhodothermus marinus]BBM68549.1 N-acetyltransferase [Rhodothermus marinus]BBM71517.1 N-acetyltransferase [Rhodothermus marinus]
MPAEHEVVLRPFRPDDLPALVDVYMAAYRDFPEYGEPDEVHALRYLQWLQRHHTLFLVAEVEGQPVGFIVVDANWRDWNGRRIGEIHELAVHPEYWGRSIARRLLDAAMNHIRAEGLQQAGLWVGVRNERAQSFYRRIGFRRSGKPWGAWIKMVKSL